MRNRAKRLLGIVFVALLSAVSTGCADIEEPMSSSGSGAGGSGGTSTSTSQGGQINDNIGPIEGNSGGDMTPSAGADFVGASGASKSGSYRMEYSVGQPISQGVSSSTSYRIQTGPVGATWSQQ